jgi:hypothetical protein
VYLGWKYLLIFNWRINYFKKKVLFEMPRLVLYTCTDVSEEPISYFFISFWLIPLVLCYTERKWSITVKKQINICRPMLHRFM